MQDYIKEENISNESLNWILKCLGVYPPDGLSDIDYELWILNHTTLKGSLVKKIMEERRDDRERRKM